MLNMAEREEDFVRSTWKQLHRRSEDQKHTKNGVIRQCLLADGIVRVQKGRPCNSWQEYQMFSFKYFATQVDRLVSSILAISILY